MLDITCMLLPDSQKQRGFSYVFDQYATYLSFQ